MVNWSVTATTLYCAAVDDEVTVMVFKDGTFKCAAFSRYQQLDKETAQLLREKGKRAKRTMKCAGGDCTPARQYRDKLFAEEDRQTK